MPRNRGRVRGDNQGGQPNFNNNNNDDDDWSPRGSHNPKGARVWKSAGHGGRSQHHRPQQQQHHQRHNSNKTPRWKWPRHHQHNHGDADSTDPDSDSDVSDLDQEQLPAAENNVFSLLLPPSTAKGRGLPPRTCWRPDCERAKKDLTSVRRRDRRLHRALVHGLQGIGQGLVDFIYGGEDGHLGYNDAESMDWTPEPTVTLIVAAASCPEPATPPLRSGLGLGVHHSVSPAAQQQLPTVQVGAQHGWVPNLGIDGCGQWQGLGHGHAVAAGESHGPQAGVHVINSIPLQPGEE